MRFDIKNTCIDLLNGDGEIFIKPGPPANILQYGDFVDNVILNNHEQLRANIQYASWAFIDTSTSESERLFSFLITETVSQTGTFILPIPNSDRYSTIFYKLEIDTNELGFVTNGWILVFYKDFPSGQHHLETFAEFNGRNTITGFGYDFQQVREITTIVANLILLQKFCDIETKVTAIAQQQTHAATEVTNDTKFPIQILDNTWFTTIHRTEPFTVGGETGHYRWQHYGPGCAQKKLVWIAPYQKKGYTRKAKVLKNNPNHPDMEGPPSLN